MEEIKIQGTELRVKEYDGKRVVTFKDIDMVHRRPLGTASRNFNQNLVRFIEGKDFYNVKLTDNEIRRAYGVGINQGNIKVITETGYLMLVKSFTDDLAWEVQRDLVNTYFKAREGNQEVHQTVNQTVEVTESSKPAHENPEILIRAVEALSGCQEGNRPYVLNILRHIVPDIDQLPIEEKKTQVKVKTKTEIKEPKPVKKKNEFWRQGVDIDVDKMLFTAAEQGISITELAKRSQVTVSTMTNWIAGKHRPVQENRTSVCVALGKDADYLTPRGRRTGQ